ncbi:SusC/RagA family TonB-linked outer membrane protein [Niabella beijingensis]|uniref:SusC/RagA family TonB-linked outer membrane protein n=1 Tax=Niabella beijingensis TaxID=2872700 RepID=UPI001CBB09F7|nr:TonB-dependent receptor [Niabella beijingensis]MBZ4192282.1 TonB-dependent receptor [Niabella beijingensis]
MRRFASRLLLPVFLSCSGHLLLAQSVNVSGKVLSESGEVLSSTTITIENISTKEKKGIVADMQGSFLLQNLNVKQRYNIYFDHVGFQPDSLTSYFVLANEKNSLLIRMKPVKNALDDIVVIGYSKARKRDLTGSVSSVATEALSDRTLLSLADALKGKAAGVQITQNDGTPGSENTIRIRGASSISGGTTPLFVVDGVFQDDMNNLNPGDIESVDILKDASGTAMYGARGANGVILITTKSGKAGKTRLELYANMAFQKPGHMFGVLNAPEYAHARFLATGYLFTPADANDPDKPASVQPGYTYFRDSPLGTPGNFWGVALDQTYANWQSYASPDSINTDWQRAMFQNSTTQDYRINMTGGTKDTKFSFLGGYLDQGGLVVYSGYRRYNGRFNFQQKLAQGINISTNIAYTKSETNGFLANSLNGGMTSNAIISSMLAKPPVQPLTFTDEEDNADAEGFITTNPYSLAKNITNKKSVADWLTRLALDWTISKNFSFRTTGNFTSNSVNTDAYYPKFTSAGSRFNGRAYLSRGSTNRFMNENLLYYKGRIGKDHSFNGVAGATFEQSKLNLVTAENQDYDVELLGVYGLQNGKVPIIPTYNITQWSMASFLGRLEYAYKGKYLATATFRADGSSRFSRDNKWAYFPSAALAWRISDENFMKDLRSVSNLKLRASIGQSGNTSIPSYLTLSTIGTYFSPMDGKTPDYGVIVERPENTSLKWETTTQVNTGLDLGLFDNNLNLTVEWYSKTTRDLLIQKITPGYSGYRSTWTNLGSIRNSGVEASINAAIFKKTKFTWNIDANIGFNRSKAIEIGADLGLDPGVVPGIGTTAIIRNGQPIGQWFGYQTNGIWQSRDEILASGLTVINGQDINSIRPGTRRFIDQNGDGIINTEDRVILGLGQPTFMGGITNYWSYRGFSLNMVFQYSYGNKIYNANRVSLESGRNTGNMTKGIAGAWRPSLYDMSSGALFEAGNPGNTYRMPGSSEELLMLSDWIEDGSFIRLSDITLSYDLGSSWLKRSGIRGVTLFVSGKNLWIQTKYSGYDPEVNTRQGGFGDLMPSLDYASYPRSKFYSAGLKIQF